MKKPRPKLPTVSEQMKAWSAALAAESRTWPAVTFRPMFGFTALYHRKHIFAVLPLTRGIESANSLAFKFPAPSPRLLARLRKEPRIHSTIMQKSHWFTFELSSDRDLRDALDWLSRAYEAAG
jgi:predicted DNA-binding protein (MmcQ/YjbR family)